MSHRAAALILAAVLTACGPIATAGPGCRPVRTGIVLPDELRESSGVAVSLRYPGTLWTHNDNGSLLMAVDRDGQPLASFRLSGRLRDWEDMAVGRCGDGDSCLFLADLGDNYEERSDLRILRLLEPDPGTPQPSGSVLSTEEFPVRLPDGPRDIEAMMVLPSGRILVVTKGRNHPLTVYRYPGTLATEALGETATLEEIQRLSTGPRILPRQVTGGSAGPGGEVVLRTYESLRFYRMDGDTLAEQPDGLVNLRTLQEPQGEAVGLGLDGDVVVTSEGGPGGGPASLNILRCSLGS